MSSSPHRIFLSVLLSALALGTQAQTIRVLAADDNLPLPSAKVICKSLDGHKKAFLVTDENGKTVITNTFLNESNTAIVTVSSVGYKPVTDTIPSRSNKTYKLQPVSIQSANAVVTAQYGQKRPENVVHKIVIIDEAKIKNMAAVNLKDVLTNEMNIRISQDNILGSSMSLQGVSGQNVKIMIDGVPILGRQDGNLDLSQINLNDVARIEIVEGPLSVNYGTNALAGTINIITKKSSADKYSGSVSSYSENIGTFNFTANAAARFKKNHRLSFSGGRNFFDGWNPNDQFWPSFNKTIADTTRVKSWKPREQYFGRLQYNYTYKKLIFGYKTEFFKEHILNRGYPRAPYWESAFDDHYHTTRFDNALYANGKITKYGSINFLAAGNYYRRIKNTFVKDLTDLEQEMTQTPGDQDTSVMYQWMSRGSYAHSNDSNWYSYEVGYDVNYETATGVRIVNLRQTMGDYAVFATAEIKPFKKYKLVVRPGLRAAYNTRYQAPLIPSLNLKYNFRRFTFRASYAYGFRAPSLKELYFYFVDINHNIIGNPNLKAEKSNNYSLSANYRRLYRKSLFQTDVSAFYNDIGNLITLAFVQGTEYSYINIGNYRTIGVNVNQGYTRGALKTNLGFSYTGRYNQLSETDPNVERFSYSPEVRANLTYDYMRAGMTFAIFYKYQGKLPGFNVDVNGNISNTFIAAYQMMDATVTKSIWKERFLVSLGCKNIFDVKNVASMTAGTAHSAGGTSLPVATGRLFFLKLDFNFARQ